MGEPEYFDAYDRAWVPLANAGALIELLARLEPAGVLQRLRTTTPATEVGLLTGLDPETTKEALRTLELSGVVTRTDQTFVLTPPWLALTDPGAFMPLSVLLAGQSATGKMLRNLGDVAYWDQPSQDRLALARAVSPNPYSDELVAAYRAGLAADHVGQQMLVGGRMLELGCGVAGRILLTLRAAPKLTAVGIELSEDLAAEGERRAQQLGLSDRFKVVCGDATRYVADDLYDYGFWSQFFFPEHTRTAALKVMFSSLRPGASFQAPIGSDPDATTSSTNAATEEAVWHMMLRAWGVPSRTLEGLAGECEAAGFVRAEVVKRGAGPAVRAWKPN